MHPYNAEQKEVAAERYRKLKRYRDAGLKLREIAELEGITRERVRQILKRGALNDAAP